MNYIELSLIPYFNMNVISIIEKYVTGVVQCKSYNDFISTLSFFGTSVMYINKNNYSISEHKHEHEEINKAKILLNNTDEIHIVSFKCHYMQPRSYRLVCKGRMISYVNIELCNIKKEITLKMWTNDRLLDILRIF